MYESYEELFENIETCDLIRIIRNRRKSYVELQIPEEPHHFIAIRLTDFPDEEWPEKGYKIFEAEEAREIAQSVYEKC